jgi:hypothetical protein
MTGPPEITKSNSLDIRAYGTVKNQLSKGCS